MGVTVDIVLRDQPTPEDPFRTGSGMGSFADDEDCLRITQAAGVRPFSDYYAHAYGETIDDIAESLEERGDKGDWRNREHAKRQQWHDPREGLRTVQALLAHYQPLFEEDPEDDDLEEIINDLTAFAVILQQAVEAKDAFRIEVSA